MSGGTFDYIQFRIQNECCEKLKELIETYDFENNITKEKALLCYKLLNDGAELLHQLDLVFDGDISENSFIDRING